MAINSKAPAIDSALPSAVSATLADGALEIRFAGSWVTRHAVRMEAALAAVKDGRKPGGTCIIDLSGVSRIDTAGAWLINRLKADLASAGVGVTLSGPLSRSGLIQRVLAVASLDPVAQTGGPGLASRLLETIGRNAVAFWLDVLMAFDILGATVRGAQMKAHRSSRLSIAPVVAQIDKMGVGAVPIVVLMSTIIGAIIAQQGAFQLRYFGAELYTVDLVGILVLRELGVLTTAIMIAGRSGSAITAEIGSMKMREEVDALKVMGLNPVAVLVFPRLAALMIVLPLLTVIANFAALGGAAVVASIYSGISFEAFLARLREAVDLSSVFSGLIKAPFMALIIGVIAAVEGLKVKGSAESLGLCVTRSVVKSIFVVIVVDGLFAMFYAAIDF
jgi:phospholipid/cholesterol/gamma-HCH transport system permease protein